MRNIGKTSSSKPHSLTFPPSQFAHVWRIRSCNPNRSVSPEVSLSQLSGLNVRNSPHWTEFMIGMISVDQYDAISERHPVIRESPFNVFPSMQTSLWVNTRVKGTTGLVCISSSPICYKSYSWTLVSSVYTAPFSVFHVRLESPQIFGANSEGMKPVTNSFRPALRGRFFRIHPQTWHRHISMRVELYTCASGQWVNFLHNQTNLLSQIFQFIIGRHQKGVGNWVRKVTLTTIMAVTACKGHSGSELFTCGCLHSQARTHHSDAACLDLSLLETTPRTSVVLSLAQSPSRFGDGKFQLCHQLVIIFTLLLKAMLLLWFTLRSSSVRFIISKGVYRTLFLPSQSVAKVVPAASGQSSPQFLCLLRASAVGTTSSCKVATDNRNQWKWTTLCADCTSNFAEGRYDVKRRCTKFNETYLIFDCAVSNNGAIC